MPPCGVAMMIAPEVGPEPVPVRMSPMTSSTRSASRTLERPTPSVEASSRSGARRSPGRSVPSSRSASIFSRTTRHARAGAIAVGDIGVPATDLLVGVGSGALPIEGHGVV